MENEKLKVQITDDQNLERDIHSKAILSSDRQALNRYREERLRQLKLKNVIDEVDVMKQDIKDIKEMLQLLLTNK